MPRHDGSEHLFFCLQKLGRNDIDAIDRYNHKYLFLFFGFLAISTAFYGYFHDPIHCWTPAQFPSAWVNYTKTICWISNTRYIPMDEASIAQAPKKDIVYYQWVPLIFAMQSLMFLVPANFWSTVNGSIGISMNKIVNMCRDIEYEGERHQDIRYIAKLFNRVLLYTKVTKPVARCGRLRYMFAKVACFWGKRHGYYLVIGYLVLKMMYIGNTVLQLYLLNKVLGTDYWLYGIEAVYDVAKTGTHQESYRFPRVAFCDFEIRTLGNKIHQHTVQCLLHINIFNERIFIIVWFCLVIIGIANVMATLSWAWTMFASDRRSYLKRSLIDCSRYDKRLDKAKLAEFSNKYLRMDGYFILQMLEKNTRDVVVNEIIERLWVQLPHPPDRLDKSFV